MLVMIMIFNYQRAEVGSCKSFADRKIADAPIPTISFVISESSPLQILDHAQMARR